MQTATPILEALEPRRLLDAAYPTAHEQYMLELVNRARANPTAEVGLTPAEYWDGTPDLNEGLAPGTITSTPKQPLAFNAYLIDAARGHSTWMLDNDVFQHSGPGGNSPGDRMADAGYTFGDDSTWNENIGWKGTTGSYDLTDFVAKIEAALFGDEGVAGRGHRIALMKDSLREIGIGIDEGVFTDGSDYNAVMATQDFARNGTDSFLCGVVYDDDLVTDDDFFTPGEELGGITITAVREPDGHTCTTTTWASGGYQMVLPPGTYTVTASGAALGTVTVGGVVIGSENVKQDFTPDTADTTTASTPSIAANGIDADVAAAELLYAEMDVDFAADGTAYCAIDGGAAQFGLVADAGSGNAIFFSVLDGSQPTIEWADPAAETLRFVGAESGVSVRVPFDWDEATNYKFGLQLTPDDSATLYDAFFYNPDAAAWQHVATVSRPVENDAFTRFGSFIEDYGHSPGADRAAYVANTWLRKAGGTWVDATAALYTSTGADPDVDADVSGDAWYLETGGSTVNNTPSGTVLSRAAGVQPGGNPPALSRIDTADGIEDFAVRFSYGTLCELAHEFDLDGDAVSFRVENVARGTLTKGGAPVTPGTTTLSDGEEWLWTPPAELSGTVTAFSVVANDGTYDSGDAVAVPVELVDVGDAGWNFLAAMGGDTLQIRDLAFDPEDASVLYAATEGGLYRSADGGGTWTEILNGIHREVEIDPTDPDTILVAGFTSTNGYGVYRSTNGGDDWTFSDTGLTETFLDSLGIASAASSTVFAGGVVDGKLQKSTDGGLTWAESVDIKALRGTGNNVYLKDLAVSADGQTVVVLASELYYNTGNLYRTDNGGTSWSRLYPPYDDWGDSVALDPNDADTIFLGTANGLYRSTNGGTSWSKLTDGLGGTADISAIAVSPQNSDLVYCAADDTGFVSTDGGDSWTQTGTAPPEEIQDAAIAPSDFRSVVFAAGPLNPAVDAGDYEGVWGLAGNGTIAGRVWNDVDDSGTAGLEPGLPGRTVFLDLDGDSTLDPGEPTVTTGPDGSYTFRDLQPGAYDVVLQARSGWTTTAPVAGSIAVGLDWGDAATGNDFGSHNDAVLLVVFDWNATEGVEEIRQLDPSTGAITTLGTVGDLRWWHGEALFDAATNRAYVTGATDTWQPSLYAVDVASGSLLGSAWLDRSGVILVGADDVGDLVGIAWDAAISTYEVLSIDPDNGATSETGELTGLYGWQGDGAVSADRETLYAIGSTAGGDDQLFVFDLGTGAVTATRDLARGNLTIAGLDAAGDLIGLGWDAGALTAFRIAVATGTITEIGLMGDVATWTRQCSLDPVAGVLYAAGSPAGGSPKLYQMTLATAAVTSDPSLGDGFDAFAAPRPQTADVDGPSPLQKGVSLPIWTETVDLLELRESLDDAVNAGVTYVAVNAIWFQETITSTVIAPDVTLYSPSNETVRLVIDEAHDRGLAVMLKPMVNLSDDGSHWRGQIVGSEEWFTGTGGYGDFMAHFADLAEETGCEMLAVGTELVAAVNEDADGVDEEALWRAVVADLRGRFSGELVYAANHGGDGAVVQATISWWDALDYIGIDAYYGLTDLDDPTVAQLAAAWDGHADRIEAWWNGLDPADRKPILFTEIGYRSWDGANKNPTDMSDKTGTDDVDQQEQADCYTAVFQTLWNRRGWLRGLYWWNWEIDPDEENSLYPSWYPIQDKLAEDVLKSYYTA
jgi:hypothetical protein